MQLKISFLCLLIIHLCFIECSAEDVEASCDTICHCSERVVSFSSKEYRTVCNGDGTQRVVLTDKLFQTESVPDMTRTSYVRIEGFRGAKIEESFLSKWLAYTSCSFDIWNSGRIAFPKSVGKVARTKAYIFVFAGIGVLNSTIEEFPDKLFKKRSTVGLKLIKSQIEKLNLFKLAAKKLNYLKVKQSLIKVFDGNPKQFLTLARHLALGEGNISIHNSEVGYLSRNALSFNDYKSHREASVKISESTIGIVETSAIHIGRNISLEIKDSRLNKVMPDAFSFVENRIFPSSITRNFFSVDDNWMKHLKCDSSLQIEDNIINTRKVLTGCNLGSYQDDNLLPCNTSLERSDYLDSSCENNNIIGQYCLSPQPPEPTLNITSSSETTTLLPFITTASTTTQLPPNTATRCVLLVASSAFEDLNNDDSSNDTFPQNLECHDSLVSARVLTVSYEMLYLVIGVCIFLIVMVTILTCTIVRMRTKRQKKKRSEAVCINMDSGSQDEI